MPGDGRLLDLYGGGEPAASPATTAPSPAGPAAVEKAADWIEVLWRGFPRAIRDRYAPRAVIGEGGMGVVIEADDRELRRVVAVKGVRDPRGISADARSRHAREARISARLTHPNILPVFDTWTDSQGNAWCSMLRVPGQAPTLSNQLARDDGTGSRLQVFLQVCRAIAYAHGCGVLHRDLKPENVLIGPTGEALVADWGVATSPAEPAAPGEVVGTPGYAASEQMGHAGEVRADARADVHALGVMLCELLGAPPPRPGAPPVDALPARTPRELAAIARRATARDPRERYADAAALQRAVETFLEGGLVEGMQYSAAERAVKWLRARPAVLLGLGAVAMFVAVSLANGMRVSAQLAIAQASLAETAWERGERSLARHYAALAYGARDSAHPWFELPRPLASAIFLSSAGNDRLLDARTLDFAAEVAVFDPKTAGVVAATRRLSWWTFAPRGAPRGVVREQSQVWGVAVSVQSRRVAVGGAEGPVKLYDLDTGELLATMAGHASSLWALAFSPDGKWLATGSFDRTVKIWDVTTRTCARTLERHRDQVWIVAWSPDGRHLASGSVDGSVHVWEVGGQWVRALDGGREVMSLAFCPEDPQAPDRSRWLAIGSALPHIQITSWETGRSVRQLHTGASVLSLSFFSNRRLASGGHHSKVQIWDPATGEEKLSLAGHTNWVSCVGFSPDGKRLATAAQDKTMRVWDIADEQSGPFQGHARSVLEARFSPDGAHLVTGDADTLRVWTVPGGAPVRRLLVDGELRGFHVDARLDGWLVVKRRAPRGGAEQHVLERRADGAPVKERTFVLGPAIGQTRVAFDGRGARVAVMSETGAVEVFATGDGKRLHAFTVEEKPAVTLALSPTGTWLAAGGTGRDVHLYRLADGWRRRLSGHTETVVSLAFSADGMTLASGSQDFSLRVWDVVTGAPLATGRGLNHVQGLGFDPRGRLVAGGGTGGLLTIWDTATGRTALRLQTSGQGVQAVTISAGGRWLATAGGQSIDVYDLDAWRRPGARIARLLASSLFEVSGGEERLLPRAVDEP